MNPRERLTEILNRLAELNDVDQGDERDLTDDEQTELESLLDEHDTVRADVDDLDRRDQARQRARDLAATHPPTDHNTVRGDEPPPTVDPDQTRAGLQVVDRGGDPYDLSQVRGTFADPATTRSDLQSRALRAVDAVEDHELDNPSRERMHRFLRTHDDETSWIARRILATGTEAYKRAMLTYLRGHAPHGYSPEEAQAVQRAMSLTNAGGGFAVPFPIDPTLINLGDGSVSPFRDLARVVPNHMTDTWQGIASTQMSASFDAEASEVSDDTTTFSQPTITVRTARAFVPASFEIAGDYPNLVADLTELFSDAKMTLEDEVFATGAAGSNQPIGIVTALTGTSSEIDSATTDTLAVADVDAIWEALPPRYRGAASRNAFVSNIAIYLDLLQAGTAGNPGPFVTEPPVDRLRGQSWREASEMDGTIDACAENRVLVVGDWRNYVIVDRIGFNLEFVPQLFATANNRPSGQRGYLAWWRVGADSVNDNGFRMLNVT